ncbi:MAG: dehydrogenase [Caulobacterales bacterium RIFCSPHIGHO2_01_FULL_70_19]|nr:MAG: dehydrogenase [Caulobacterales bacterium RIFCSPHIGHO2_01_FULL_70_19]
MPETAQRRRILILDGHPDPAPDRFCHALAAAYAQGAASAGHVVHRLNLADLEVPPLTSRAEWESETPSPSVVAVQEELLWAEHLVIIYPLWLGDLPARLKGLLEQVLRPAFAFGGKAVSPGAGRLKGRSARVIVTMGMPALIYRTVFLGHSLAALKRGVLALVGFRPVRDTVFGGIETRRDRARLLAKVGRMGAQGA